MGPSRSVNRARGPQPRDYCKPILAVPRGPTALPTRLRLLAQTSVGSANDPQASALAHE